MNSPNIRSKGFGATVAMGLVLAVAAPDIGRAQHRTAGHPAHVNGLPRPAMKSLQPGTVVAAALAAHAPPVQQPIATAHAEDVGHAGDHSHDHASRGVRIIVVGVPSVYYYGDGGPAGGPSPLEGANTSDCTQTFSVYDPKSGDDGKAHPCP